MEKHNHYLLVVGQKWKVSLPLYVSMTVTMVPVHMERHNHNIVVDQKRKVSLPYVCMTINVVPVHVVRYAVAC